MSSIYLFEDYDPSHSHNYNEEKIVSLTPAVSYLLSRRKIKHHTLKDYEDYYDEKQLKTYEEEYFFRQIKWFDCFDNFIKDKIPFCKEYDIPLAKANYLRIKYFVDTVIINSFVLSQFFQNNRDLKEIIYVHTPIGEYENYSIFDFKPKSRKVFSELLQLFCKKYNVVFTEQLIAIEDKAQQGKYFLDSFRKNIFLKNQAKNIVNFIKYEKYKKLISIKNYFKDLNILFMHAGSVDIDYPIKEVMKYKANIFVWEKGRIIQEDNLLRKQIDVPELDENYFNKLQKECEAGAGSLEKDNEIISWISNECLLDVSSIILPFLRFFISKDCFYILRDAENMFNFYKQNEIDYVFARGNTDRNSLGPLVAAKYMKGSESVCVQHACLAVDTEVFGVFETETYNYTLTRDSISQDYFECSLKDRYRTDCKFVQSSHYLKSIEKEYSRKKKREKREKIVYVEKRFLGRVRCFNKIGYSLNWYFEFQREIINYFVQETGFDFIYKHTQGQEWAEHSILRHVKDSGSGNIEVYSGHFLKTIKFADRVIMDYPSGALFEAAASGKPVLCIYADYFSVLKQAEDIFGKSLQKFSSIDEAILIIKEFLYSDPEGYIVDLNLSQSDFLQLFRSRTVNDFADFSV